MCTVGLLWENRSVQAADLPSHETLLRNRGRGWSREEIETNGHSGSACDFDELWDALREVEFLTHKHDMHLLAESSLPYSLRGRV